MGAEETTSREYFPFVLFYCRVKETPGQINQALWQINMQELKLNISANRRTTLHSSVISYKSPFCSTEL